jgi:hypothetical protein
MTQPLCPLKSGVYIEDRTVPRTLSAEIFVSVWELSRNILEVSDRLCGLGYHITPREALEDGPKALGARRGAESPPP